MKRFVIIMLAMCLCTAVFAQTEGDGLALKPKLPDMQRTVGVFFEPFMLLGETHPKDIAYGVEYSKRDFIFSWFAIHNYVRLNIPAFKYLPQAYAFNRDFVYPTIGDSWKLLFDTVGKMFGEKKELWMLLNVITLGMPILFVALVPVVATPVLVVVGAAAFLTPFNFGVDLELHPFRTRFIDTFLSLGLSSDPAKMNLADSPFSKDESSKGLFLPVWPLVTFKVGVQGTIAKFVVHLTAAFETSAVYAGMLIAAPFMDKNDGTTYDFFNKGVLDICDASLRLGVSYSF